MGLNLDGVFFFTGMNFCNRSTELHFYNSDIHSVHFVNST